MRWPRATETMTTSERLFCQSFTRMRCELGWAGIGAGAESAPCFFPIIIIISDSYHYFVSSFRPSRAKPNWLLPTVNKSNEVVVVRVQVQVQVHMRGRGRGCGRGRGDSRASCAGTSQATGTGRGNGNERKVPNLPRYVA